MHRRKLQRQGRCLSQIEIVRATFHSGYSPALLLNHALKSLGKTREHLRFFQKPVLPYIGHVVYGSVHGDRKKVLYLCEKTSVGDDTKWEDVTHNPFALRLWMYQDGHDLEMNDFDVIIAVVDDDGNVLRASVGFNDDVQNEVHQTAHYHRNSLKLRTRLVEARAMSLYRKCEQVANTFVSNLRYLVGEGHCKSLRFDLMILNNTDSLWQRAMFVKRNQQKVYVLPCNGWTRADEKRWQKSLQALVVEIAQLVLLNAGKVEHNYSFLPDRLSTVCNDIDTEQVRQFLFPSCRDVVKARETLAKLFAHFVNIAECESEKNLSRSSTPNTSPLRENLMRLSPRSSPLRSQY